MTYDAFSKNHIKHFDHHDNSNLDELDMNNDSYLKFLNKTKDLLNTSNHDNSNNSDTLMLQHITDRDSRSNTLNNNTSNNNNNDDHKNNNNGLLGMSMDLDLDLDLALDEYDRLTISLNRIKIKI
ncbi:unnamed protein product [[Candida] boidinii]|uniref:Unnamed protein product n=1 Tax=Candida boidinii TaxID=5477 RepID=A0ACB5U8B9_CANBO|nr:unnamed protein product [[Candida] boidinii]